MIYRKALSSNISYNFPKDIFWNEFEYYRQWSLRASQHSITSVTVFCNSSTTGRGSHTKEDTMVSFMKIVLCFFLSKSFWDWERRKTYFPRIDYSEEHLDARKCVNIEKQLWVWIYNKVKYFEEPWRGSILIDNAVNHIMFVVTKLKSQQRK